MFNDGELWREWVTWDFCLYIKIERASTNLGKQNYVDEIRAHGPKFRRRK